MKHVVVFLLRKFFICSFLIASRSKYLYSSVDSLWTTANAHRLTLLLASIVEIVSRMPSSALFKWVPSREKHCVNLMLMR